MFIILDAVVVHATQDVKYKGSKYQKLYPSNKTFYNTNNGKCITFSLKDLKDVKEIEMKSPVPINIYLHEEDQFYSKELTPSISFNSKQSFERRISKTINLDKKERQCFSGMLFSD